MMEIDCTDGDRNDDRDDDRNDDRDDDNNRDSLLIIIIANFLNVVW